MGKTIMVNGVDFTPYITPWGYTVGYCKIQGGNQGTMLDGSFIDDVLAYKISLSVTCMPLTDDQYSTVTSTLYDRDREYATVKFYDPDEHGYRTAECTFSTANQVERGTGSDGKVYWTGLSLTFEER